MDNVAAVEIKVDYQSAPSMVARRRVLPNDFHIQPHWHGRAQFLFAVSGVMRVSTPRRIWIVPPTRALWIPAHVIHEIYMTSAVDMRTLYIDTTLTEAMPETCAVLDMSPLMRELVVRMTGDAPSASDRLERQSEGDRRAADLSALLEDVIAAEMRRLPICGLDLPLPESEALVVLCRRILADLSIPLDVQAEADRMAMSARTLIRHFIKETGLSPMRWLQQARLLEAVRRLSEGDPVTHVALDLGYQSPSAFTAMFQRTMGAPPRVWRRRDN